MSELLEYYCEDCHIKITTDEPGYVECPTCKSGAKIKDYGDYEGPSYLGQDFNYNKK